MSTSPVRPSSAPIIGYEIVEDQEEIVKRCYRCFSKIVGEEYASIAGTKASDERKYFCSKKCFKLHIGAGKDGRRKRLVHFALTTVRESNLKKG